MEGEGKLMVFSSNRPDNPISLAFIISANLSQSIFNNCTLSPAVANLTRNYCY